MRRAAKRRLPRFAFDFMEGGAGREAALARNVAAFDRVCLVPHILSGAGAPDTSIELFAETFSAPIAIAPLGMAGLVAPGADIGMARAAAAAAAPYVLSTAATTSIEAVSAAAPGSWFQLYVGRYQAIVDDLLDRAQAAGVKVLVVTVDVPAPGNRVRDLENGFRLPLKISPSLAADVLLHPSWALSMARNGPPRFANLQPYQAGGGVQSLATLMAEQSSARLDWRLLGEIRNRWRGALLVKGVLRPQDATRLVGLGVDGLIVSNHGGRQWDSAPTPLEMTPAIRAAVGNKAAVIMDGGVRSGEDVARAIAYGADLVMLGRPFLYAAAALGPQDGAATLLAVLTEELRRTMIQLGCLRLVELRARTEPPSGPAADAPIANDPDHGFAGCAPGRGEGRYDAIASKTASRN